jgi:hypothetical protein
MTTSHFSLAIDQRTNDIFLSDDGNLSTVSNAEAVGQHARQRLSTFKTEWFLDTTAGLPWLDEVLGHNYDAALAEAIVKAELSNTDGVTEITSFSVSFDFATRGLVIKSVDVNTVYDEEVSL